MAFKETQDQAQPRKPREERANKDQAQTREERVTRAPVRNWSASSAETGRAGQFVRMVREASENKPMETSVVREVDNSVGLSAAYGYVVYADNVNNDLFWHLIVFESEVKPVYTEMKNRGRRNYNDDEKVFEFTSTIDNIDEELVTKVGQWVRDNIAVSGDYVFTNATIVPTDMDLANVSAINLLAFDAEDSNILISDTDTPFSAAMLNKTSQLICKLDYSSQDKLDMSGQPLRSDFSIAIEEKFREKGTNQMLNKSGTCTIVEVDGFVNARWVGHARSERGRKDVSPACYVPEIIASEINPYHNGVWGGNFERLFLGISSLLYLKEDDVWMKQFESSIHATGGKVSSLAYGMDWPEGIPADLELVDKDPAENIRWVESVFHTDANDRFPVDFAILVKEGGIGYTTAKLLLDVADGVPSALDKVRASLDALTNSVFGDTYSITRASDVIAGQVRIPTGHFKTSEGIRPCEDLDTTYVLTMLKDNYPEMLEDYIECTQVSERAFDADTAMTKLVNIYQHVTGNEFVLKGFSTKLYIEPDLLRCLAEAVQHPDAGLNMELDTAMSTGIRTSRRRQYKGDGLGLTDSPFSRARGSHSGVNRTGYRTQYRGGRN